MTTRVMGCVDEEWGSIRRMRRCFRISARFAVLVAFTLPRLAVPAYAEPSASAPPSHVDCASARLICTEVQNPEEVFGKDVYVGHDEPSLLFYSNTPGSGNQMTYQLTLPTDPSTLPTQGGGGTFNFQLHPAFWFGMAMCDTQSYPVQVSTCTPDSDSNIVDPAVTPNHPGTAFMELQFYPPGYVQQFTGFSCDATRWCVAMTIDSLMVNLHDSRQGLVATVRDLTTHQSGSMTASAANSFGQVQYAPTGTGCN